MCRNVSLGSSVTSNVPRYSDGTEGNAPSLNFVQSVCLLILQHKVIVVLLCVALQYAYGSLQYNVTSNAIFHHIHTALRFKTCEKNPLRLIKIFIH